MGKAQKLKEERREARLAATERRQSRRTMVLRTLLVVGIVIVCGAIVAALASTNHKSANTAKAPAATAVPTTNATEATMNKKVATISTDKGDIVVELYPDKAPKTVEQITTLINRGFYNGLVFHRVEPGFVIQGGDPKGDGTGGSDLPNIPFENNDLKHDKGVIAMARSQDRDSANSQFYITLADVHSLDGNYVVFGKVISGIEVVDKIQKGDKMNKITLQP